MKNTLRRIGIIALVIAAASGCAVSKKYNNSAPQLGSRLHDIKNHRVELDGLKLHIQPRNQELTAKTFFFLFFPISYEKYSPPIRSAFLELDFFVYAETSGYTFSPKDILLHVNDNEPVRPTLIAGPIDGKNQDGGPLLRSIGRIFGMVQCRSGKGSDEFRSVNNEISIDDVEEWLCFKLHFPISPPSPDENIEIRVTGLRKNQTEVYPPIAIKYSKATNTSHSSIP